MPIVYGVPRKANNPLYALSALATKQLHLAQQLSKSLENRAKTKAEIAPDWTPDEDWRRDFQSVTTALQHAGQGLIRAQEGTKKNLGTLTEKQLEEQLVAELKRGAAAMTDEEWQAMADARAKRKP